MSNTYVGLRLLLERGINIKIYLRQLKSILIHKWYVYLAGRVVGVPIWRLIIHDWSKFAPVEFVNYSRFRYGVKSANGWAKAWLHHLHYNPHHPEHWVLSWRGNPDFYDDIGERITDFVTILPMPETYVQEMVADMLGTGRQVTGLWDIAPWLNQNGPTMLLHYDTITHLRAIMSHLGYISTDDSDWAWEFVESIAKVHGVQQILS